MSPTTSPATASPGSPGTANSPGTVVVPLGALDFHAAVEGRNIGRFAECTGLAVEYDVVEYAEGGNNEFVHRLRGAVRYPNVTLGRGVTNEDALLDWFYEIQKAAERPTLVITLNDALGTPMREFALRAALPVRWTGPNVAAGSNSAATESLEIAHLGFV